jgi:predicted nucleotidyltransferase
MSFATLREHEAELRSVGIVRLSVFGSVARAIRLHNRTSI